MCGSTASVSHYNFPSRALVGVFNEIPCVLTVGHFDGFGRPAPLVLMKEAPLIPPEFRETLGVS